MLTVSNLDHMRSNVMRKLFDLFENAFHVQMEEDLRVSNKKKKLLAYKVNTQQKYRVDFNRRC